MSAGNIERRGPRSWRLKFDIGRDQATGKRNIRRITVRGTKRDAQAELARLLAAYHAGTLVEPSALTVRVYLRQWVVTAETLSISPKTAERYRQLIENQILPHLGGYALQKLKAAHIADWHAALLREGGHEGRALAPRTVGHAHRVLHRGLEDAMRRELLTRNPAALVSPPTISGSEIEILSADQVKAALIAMRDRSFTRRSWF